MLAAKEGMEDQDGLEEPESHFSSDWNWRFLSGKASAIRWVLGCEWYSLDS